jgi:hypothetical protein
LKEQRAKSKIIALNRKDGEFVKQLREHVISAFPNLIGQNAPTRSVKGIPEPPLIGFFFDKTPHLVGFDAYLNLKVV